jgi:hypothetical protein
MLNVLYFHLPCIIIRLHGARQLNWYGRRNSSKRSWWAFGYIFLIRDGDYLFPFSAMLTFFLLFFFQFLNLVKLLFFFVAIIVNHIFISAKRVRSEHAFNNLLIIYQYTQIAKLLLLISDGKLTLNQLHLNIF